MLEPLEAHTVLPMRVGVLQHEVHNLRLQPARQQHAQAITTSSQTMPCEETRALSHALTQTRSLIFTRYVMTGRALMLVHSSVKSGGPHFFWNSTPSPASSPADDAQRTTCSTTQGPRLERLLRRDTVTLQCDHVALHALVQLEPLLVRIDDVFDPPRHRMHVILQRTEASAPRPR